MKQQIVCMDCKKTLRSLFPTDTPYPGEHVKFIDGKALDKYHCDHCDKDINVGDECCAHSIWADHGGQPYYSWEKDFIDITEEESKHERF